MVWEGRDSNGLSVCFSFKNPTFKHEDFQKNVEDYVIRRYLEHPIFELVSAHLKCVQSIQANNFNEAYLSQSTIVQGFIKMFQQCKEDNWLLPVVQTVSLNLRLVSNKVDNKALASSIQDGNSGAKPRDARTSENDSKKWGMLPFVNQLFKVYFRISKLHLMKPLIRAIESSQYKDKSSLSQQITYKYYVGRKAMFDSDYKTANEYLTFAFQRCHKSSKKNKRLILIYLVPVKMLLGFMPTRELLDKYDLLQLWDVTVAVKGGQINQLSDAMTKHQTFFIKCGIYLILEKLKMITYRNLFKKVYNIHKDINKNSVVELQQFLQALHYVEGKHIDLEDTHCLLCNLIHDGQLKGYISLAHQKVVLSKTDPFPKLSAIASAT
ncbi:hypothetical protein M8J76_016671 [Diaphorina citri]|nr:hypothetical protein M8J75_004926 [Diaphorina citri]KAI5737774.1 hypothetical protein M8J76_016671 [Diaphorina citri]